jgi:hypothetical protein
MEKDIFYPNNHNAFFINEESQNSNFSLICGYEKPTIIDGSFKNIWETKEIDFSELNFGKNFQTYWFDYEKEKNEAQKELEKIRFAEFGKLWEKARDEDERRYIFDKYQHLFNIKNDDVKFYELSSIIDCLYSIKFKKVIGYNYHKLIQLLHQYFQKESKKDSHFGEYIFKAIGIYGAREKILSEDKTQKFVNRARDYKKQNYLLCHRYDNILKCLFPEIFDESKN